MLSVRLPAVELRRFKSRAAAQGLSMQSAAQAALRDWVSRADSDPMPSMEVFLDEMQGALAGTDILRMRRRDKSAERDRERRRSGR